MLEPLMTVKEVAALLNVNPMTVYRAIDTGELPHRRVGRSIRISQEDLDAYVKTGEPRVTVPPVQRGPVTRL
jgi:excisionase family DNA binding protein